MLKGVDIDSELAISDTLRHLKAGSVDRLRDADRRAAGHHSRRAHGVEITACCSNSNIDVTVPNGGMTPFGPRPAIRRFKVCGIFESGIYDIDDNLGLHVAGGGAEGRCRCGDVVNQLEIERGRSEPRRRRSPRQVEKIVGPALHHHHLDGAQPATAQRARMTERVVTMIVIGLILTGGGAQHLHHAGDDGDGKIPRYRDADVDGRAAKADAPHFHAAGRADRRRGQRDRPGGGLYALLFRQPLPLVPLDETVYSLSFVPFEAHWVDGVWIAAVAMLVSFLATIYPARNATRIAPAEVLRYE